MSQTPASHQLSQEEQEQRSAWLALHLSNVRNTSPLPSAEPDNLQLPDETPDAPLLAPPARTHSTRKRARRRRWKRHFLRRSRRRARQRERALMVSSGLGALMPLLLLVTIISMLAGVGLLYYQSEQDTLAHIGSQLPGDSLKIYDAQGNLIYDMADHGLQTSLPFYQIPKVAQNATIAIEDKDFWTNQGVDFLAVLRATIDDLRSGQIVSGGSTITQQLIKNALLGPQVTLDRKLREMILALGLTHQMSKRDILTLYLNTIYYGEQSYGIDAAAHTYFSLNDQPGAPAAAQLDLAQASLLAGLPRSPSDLDPLNNLSGALARQKAVLEQMVIQGYITPEQEVQAITEAKQPGFLKSSAPANLAPQFSNYVLQQVQTLIDQHVLSASSLSRSGLRIYTTLNLSLQNQILQIAQQHIADLAGNNVTNAAVVLIDYHTGAILTELGSIDYNDPQIDGQFDVATQGWRQPGSSFKPFVYATAFEEGWSPGTPIDDSPISIPIPNQPNYAPQNYDGRFHGLVTVRQALQNSFNVPAVKTLMFAGIQQSLSTAESMGITGYEGTPGYSMVLGGLDVKLIDETSAYGVFGDGGVRVPPYAIQSITDSSGKMLYHHVALAGTQVINPQIAGLITNVLSDDRSRQYEFGVCSPLLLYNGPSYSPGCYADDTDNVRPAAVKTGTTQDFKDNWTVGYTTDFVMGVWAGNNDGSPMYNVSGVDGAAPIWHDAMLVAEQGRPVQNFALPHGLLYATVPYPDGLTSTDWYLPGTVPANGIILGQS